MIFQQLQPLLFLKSLLTDTIRDPSPNNPAALASCGTVLALLLLMYYANKLVHRIVSDPQWALIQVFATLLASVALYQFVVRFVSVPYSIITTVIMSAATGLSLLPCWTCVACSVSLASLFVNAVALWRVNPTLVDLCGRRSIL